MVNHLLDINSTGVGHVVNRIEKEMVKGTVEVVETGPGAGGHEVAGVGGRVGEDGDGGGVVR